MKYLIGLAVVLAIGLVSSSVFNENKIPENIQKKSIVEVKQSKLDETSIVNNEIEHLKEKQNVPNTNDTSVTGDAKAKTFHYKELFKEPKIDKLKVLQEQQRIDKLDKEMNELISESDAFVKTNNLIVSYIQPKPNEIDNLNHLKEEIENMHIQFEELKNESSN